MYETLSSHIGRKINHIDVYMCMYTHIKHLLNITNIYKKQINLCQNLNLKSRKRIVDCRE